LSKIANFLREIFLFNLRTTKPTLVPMSFPVIFPVSRQIFTGKTIFDNFLFNVESLSPSEFCSTFSQRAPRNQPLPRRRGNGS
jgi:hypothetical protein